MGKLNRTQFKSKKFTSKDKPLHLVHMDLCAPSRKEEKRQEEKDILCWSLMTILDLHGFLFWKKNMKHLKSSLTENKIWKRLKAIRYDRGGEFSSVYFKEFFDKHGIKRECTILGTPQQNGVVERHNWWVQHMERSMMNEGNIS